MSFADKINREVDMFDWERSYWQFMSLPPWERYEEGNDRTPADQEPPEPTTYPTHAELEKLAGRKLLDLDKLKLPY